MGPLLTSWPEPVQRVQLLAESGLQHVPSQYVRPHADRPQYPHTAPVAASNPLASEIGEAGHGSLDAGSNIPVLDMEDLERGGERRDAFLRKLQAACEEWGFLQVRNHGVEEALIEGVRSAAGGFFKLPIAEKQLYANDPITYQGYGSRLGVSKGAVLDWGDYYFLNVLPSSSRDLTKWPTNPPLWRNMVEEYCKKMENVSKKLLGALSLSLNLQCKETLEETFGEVDMGLRINYYPPCPQPELTLGLSPHSDPGGLTLLLQDLNVDGLQVKAPASSSWVTVPRVPGALVVNLGDQLQILTNGRYKSVEHRVVVNNNYERLSIACFINPGNNMLISPVPELVPKNALPAYNAMTFKQYRSFIRSRGTNGKAHLDFVASPTSTTPDSIIKHS